MAPYPRAGTGGMTSDEATRTGLYAQSDLQPGDVLADRFRIEGLIGVGGMGVVYRASDQSLGIQVALKLLRPELATRPEAFERFRQELLLARQVSSPHVVRIHDIAQHDMHGQGRRWLISMDYIEGESLDKRLDREGALPPEDALRIARQIAEGLAAAHGREVVHRDLKPSNVLIDGEGNAYVNDFGVARSLVDSGVTQSGSVIGTPDYLSPEQARGEAVDPRSDLYALGLILYEMLSGELPFAGGTIAEILGQRMVRAPTPLTRKLPRLPPWIARLTDKLLRPQPAHRFQNARQLIDAIDRKEMPREFRPSRRVGVGILAAVVVLAAAVGVGSMGWMRQAPVASVPAMPPLHRLLVLPAAADAVSPAMALAIGDHLRDALTDAGIVVVDGERTGQSLRQLDPVGSLAHDADAARRLAMADRVLRFQWQTVPSGLRVHGTLRMEGGAWRTIDGPPAADAAAAVKAWWPMLLNALGEEAVAAHAFELPPAPALAAYGEGLQARQDGDLDAALGHFQKATAMAPGYLAAWLAQAGAAQAIGDDEKASMTLDAASRNASRVVSESLRGRLAAARALLDGDAAAAAAVWRARVESKPDDMFAALNLARARGGGGDFPAAIAGLETLSQRDGNDPRAWFELGKYAILQGDARRAIDDYLVRALVLYKRGRDAYGQAETVNALGVGYGRLGQTADAEEQYRKAVELRGALGNRRGVATSLRNLAAILSLRGKFDEAAVQLEHARTIYAALGNREGLAAAENELGLLHEERGDYPAALDAFRRALQAWQLAGEAHGAAETLNHIGFAHYQLGAYDNAQAFWQQAASAYAKLGDDTGRVRTAQNLALLDMARGRWDEARQRLQESLAVARKQQMLEEIAVCHRNLAELELWQGRLDAALDEAAKAQAMFRQRQDQRGLADTGLLGVQALLAAYADGRAAKELEALAKPLLTSPLEQRATAAVLEAELAQRRGDSRKADRAFVHAQTLAAAAGVQQLQVQIALLRNPGDPALDAETATLGHTGLRLIWLEQAQARAVAAGNDTLALAYYRESLGLLRGGAYGRAFRLHTLGAGALMRTGDRASAAAATASARTSLKALRSHIPAAIRPGFDAAPEIAMAGVPPQVAGVGP